MKMNIKAISKGLLNVTGFPVVRPGPAGQSGIMLKR